MAQIIPFPRIKRAEGRTHSGGCHVLIFPGVRIERDAGGTEPPRRTAAKAKRKTPRRHRTGT
jgi:hypothetical protein